MRGTDQLDLLCPSCAGQCIFDPAEQALACQSCGQMRALDTTVAANELRYDPDAPVTEPPRPGDEAEHQCATCGGSVIFTGAALSERCPYCNGPVVRAAPEDGYETMALIPFRVPRDIALANALIWARARKAAPSGLAERLHQGHMVGLYAPFWTFDSDEAVDYWAKYNTGSGDNKRTHSVSGKMSISFDDLLVPASPHITPLIRDGILHDFQPDKLRHFAAAPMAGFAAERHHQTVAEGLAANRDDKDLLIRNRIRRHIARNRVHSIGYRTDSSGIHYRRVLLPVWILHYSYNEKPYKVVVSGIDGRTFGERPFDIRKLALYAAGLTAGTMGFGWLWGAAGIL